MTNLEKIAFLKKTREEIKELKNQINVKSAEADKVLAEFLGISEPNQNIDMIDMIEKVYNKIHD